MRLKKGSQQRAGGRRAPTGLALMLAVAERDGVPSRSPQAETSLGLAFLADQDHLARSPFWCHLNPVPGAVLHAGWIAGDQAGAAPAIVAPKFQGWHLT